MVSKLVEDLMQEELTFEQLEKSVWETSLELFRHLMVEVLELFDQKLMDNRDKERYENKETVPRTLQTLVGEITFCRRHYKDNKEQCPVFLLDEMLGIEKEKSISPGLLKLGVLWATKGSSYRDARDRLTDIYGGQVLSHEAIRQALIEVGEASRRQLENKIITEEGKKEAKVLFVEADGFWTRLQKNKGQNRRNQGREVKMVVVHEGWRPRSNGKKPDYELVNPTYISEFEESYDFWEYVRGVLSVKYKDIDKTMFIINGDGAFWIREGTRHFSRSMYQYDRFHISRELRHVLRYSPEMLRKANRALVKNDLPLLSSIITEALGCCNDVAQKEKLRDFKILLKDNGTYIIDYRVRLKNLGFPVSEKWRGLGASESNVNKFKNRIGKRGRSWSIEGLMAILTTLSRLFEGNLRTALSRTLDGKEEWILDRITSAGGRVTSKIQGDSFGVRMGSLPATRHGTKGYSKLFHELQKVEFV